MSRHIQELSEAEWSRITDVAFGELTFERALRSRGYEVVGGPTRSLGPIGALPSDGLLKVMLEKRPWLPAAIMLLQRLRGDRWRTQGGQELEPEQMSIAHASNTVKWLEMRAKPVLFAAQIEAMCAAEDHDGGEMAHDAIEAEASRLFDEDPLEFMRSLPLYKAIADRAAQAVPLRG